jgi:hypothetical protein
MKTVLMNSARS